MLLLYGLVGPRSAEAATRLTAQETYEIGERFAKRGNYPKALDQYNRVRTYFRDDPYALKAELAIAELHFKRSEWDSARLAYEDFLRAHPRYAELDFVVFRLGMTHFQKSASVAAKDQTWTRQAVNAWTGFSSRFPNSVHGEEVQKFLSRAQNRLGRKEILIARFYDRRKAGPAVEGRVVPFLGRFGTSPDRAEALALLAEAYARQQEPVEPALSRLAEEDPKRVPAATRRAAQATRETAADLAREAAKAARQSKPQE